MSTIEKRLSASLENGIAQGIFPGGISSVSIAGQLPITVARGTLSAKGEVKVGLETVYDLASLTKVVVTLPLILFSVQAGRVSLIDPVVQYLPELQTGKDAESKKKITLYHLLTHSSGLPAWRPFFIRGEGREAYLQMIADEAMIGKPGEQAVYSDLGFMLLGFVLERVWDEPLDALARRMIFTPYGMNETTYLPLKEKPELAARIAPTEQGNGYERKMAVQYVQEQLAVSGEKRDQEMLEAIERFAWRIEIICGTVHDCNAHYGLGGVSGHAGLFSTISDLQKYMEMWTGEGPGSVSPESALDPLLRQFATRCHTRGISPLSRAVGWEASAPGGTMAQIANGCTGGDLLSPAAFGHTGFTGTSIWHDPARQATIITLTNRVHPQVNLQMPKWRRAHHNQLFSILMPRS